MDFIRWPYRATMRVRLADGSLQNFPVQWMFASDAAKPLPYPHTYGSAAYYDFHGHDLPGPGELVESGRIRNRKSMKSTSYNPRPCPDNAAMWNGYEED